jgi:prolyl-tRNA synthetase
MRMSQLFGQTWREAPTEAEIASHQLLLRAGFIRQLGAGIFSVLPLARRALNRIENIMRAEMDSLGGQELTMPVIHPADLWKESHRWYKIGSEMGRFRDKNNHDMVLAMTHEEVVADLARREVRSYRQMPLMIYHIQTKWRDDPRPRGGLVRVREFTMLDSYSLDADWDGLDRQYRGHYQAYFNIFRRCGLPVHAVGADTGMMGGKLAHEFMYLNPIGEDTLLFCDACGYRANRQVARFRRPASAEEAPRPLEKVATPGTTTIASLANLLEVPESRTGKAVFLIAAAGPAEKVTDCFVFAVVRGDMEVNEYKLSAVLSAVLPGGISGLRPAVEAEIRAVGVVPGYASPIGLPARAGGMPVLVVVDEAIPVSANLVAGANEEGYHLLNTNYGRDYRADHVADITTAADGAACPNCGQVMAARRGVEVGNIFKLGTHFSEALGCTYLDENRQSRLIVMGSYGIGVGRLLACIAEEHHDERGLAWPVSVAPYLAQIVSLAGKSGDVGAAADGLAARLTQAGLEPLYDDRSESAGVKFMDADLIGLPLRLTVSERNLKQGSLELKPRQGEAVLVPLEQAVDRVRAEIQVLESAIERTVTAEPYHV